MRTTYGSPLFASHVPAADSLLVERLRAAGAIVIGKTNTPEFGAGSQTFNAVFGATRNPWDLTRTPGGSSGGAAAAVASGMLPFADGSDLGASVRNPAAMCNLVGLRPSPGRIPDHGPGDPWNPLPVLGPIGRTVDDVALLLSALAGPDPRDPLSLAEPFAGVAEGDVRGLRIAWSRDVGGLPVDPAVTAVLEERRATLEELGCVVEDAEPDFERRRRVLRGAARRDVRGRVQGDPAPGQADAGRERALRAEPDAGADRAGVRAARRSCTRGCASSWTRYDAFAAPVTQVPAFDVELEFPAEIAGVRMGSYLEWFRSCSRITRHVASGGRRAGGVHRRTGCRSGSSSSGGRGARRSCCGSRGRSGGDGAGGAAAGALGALADARRRRRRTGRRTPTPSRGRSGWSTRSTPRTRCTASSRPTCASSAAASPGCGRRCTRRRWTRRATSSCSRPRPPGSAPAGATAGSASRR